MTIGEQLDKVLSNVDDVYAAGVEDGKREQYDLFWDSFQKEGKRVAYQNAFARWNDEMFYPKYDMQPTGTLGGFITEATIKNFKQRLIDCGVKFDTSKSTNLVEAFAYTQTITHLPEINARTSGSVIYICSNDWALVEVEKLILKDDGSQGVKSAFYKCKSLETLIIEGVIGQPDLDLRWSTKLSKASITSIINALSTSTSGLTATLSLDAVKKAFETAQGANDGDTSTEWTALVATKPNWTISLISGDEL